MKRVFRQSPSGYVEDENPYWISFSDIMSGLLIIFVMASLALILELTSKRADVNDAIVQFQRAEEARRQIIRDVQKDLSKRGINVEVSDNETVVRIPDSLLTFETNEYTIPQDGEMSLLATEIGSVLHAAISRGERLKFLDTIFIEGHTDRRPSSREMGNWSLSTSRAISLWNHWDNTLPDTLLLSSLRNHSDLPLFSVSGYAQTRPITPSQITPEDLQKNRRIDIRFTVLMPSIEQYEILRKQVAR